MNDDELGCAKGIANGFGLLVMAAALVGLIWRIATW